MAKGGTTTQKVEMPKKITEASKANIALASKVGALPYAPYFGGSVAAFQPGQMAAFENMNKAASAFGLQGSAGQGLPKAQDFGGIQGYSTQGPYEDAMSRVDPAVLELYNSFFFPENNPWKTTPETPKSPPPPPPPAATGYNPWAYGAGSRADRR